MERDVFKFIDLFAGIGGFRLALERVGGDCQGFSEINNDAIKTYCENFQEKISNNMGDITKIENLPSHDLLVGGIPCQSWSIAGKNLGFDDDRGQLWNDTIYLLNKSKPKAFIFENVKGLVDPRNKEELNYIISRIKDAGYFADCYVLNSFDFGVPQNRIRIYIVGFLEQKFRNNFLLPSSKNSGNTLNNVLNISEKLKNNNFSIDLFGGVIPSKRMSLSSSNGFNDYFLFNDLRNGHSTIHSWDIIDTTERQKYICNLLLTNRRKSIYGTLDGNPLSIKHFQSLDASIKLSEIKELVKIGIIKEEEYLYKVNVNKIDNLSKEEDYIIDFNRNQVLNIDELKSNKKLKIQKIPVQSVLKNLINRKIIDVLEIRYDFKNTKISTGLNGINRIFLPSSNIFPTLVASDTNDFISHISIKAKNEREYKEIFLEEVYRKGNYRKITKDEACKIQGFPINFILPDNRSRWMKLIGNSVSVPVIEALGKAIIETGVFKKDYKTKIPQIISAFNNLQI